MCIYPISVCSVVCPASHSLGPLFTVVSLFSCSCSNWLSVCVIWALTSSVTRSYVSVYTCSAVIKGKNSWLMGDRGQCVNILLFHLLGGQFWSIFTWLHRAPRGIIPRCPRDNQLHDTLFSYFIFLSPPLLILVITSPNLPPGSGCLFREA